MARARTTTPRIPDDARTRRSLEALRSALLALLADKSFEQISIKEICDKAELSYPTFYRRFASKEELLSHIAAEEVQSLMQLGGVPAQGSRTSPADRMCQHIQAHRALWKALLTGGAADAVRAEFIRTARTIAESQPRANPWLPVDLAVSFVTSGMFEIFAWWLNQPADYPIGKVVKLFDALIVETTARRRDISLD